MIDKTPGRYIPALNYDWLTFLYDPLLRWTMPESAFKQRLVHQARIAGGHRVLDLGCGTATLTLMIKNAQPGADVTGLDGDPKILELARSKAARARLDIHLDRAMAFDLPYRDGSFDRVVSSLVIHHLSRENKLRTLREVFRVLRGGGELHVADFGKPHNFWMRLLSLFTRRLEHQLDNVQGLLPEMIRSAGFERVEQTATYSTIYGTLALYRASKPE